MIKNVLLIGFGYMAKRVLNQLNHSTINFTGNIFSLSRSAVVEEVDEQEVKQSASQHIIYDLDKTNEHPFPKPEIFNHSSILYFVPPPAKGQTDHRIKHFLSLIQQSANLPERITLISTTGVYGHCDGAWVDETFEVKPKVDRAYRRVDAEKQLQRFCTKHTINYTILRVSGIYAEDKLPLERIKKQLPLVNETDSPFSNRIHAEDLTTICCQSLTANYPGIFNCSDNEPSTMTDYFIRLAQAYHLPAPPIINMKQAQKLLSSGMLSYMQESRRINNHKLLKTFSIKLKYPSLNSFLTKK